MPVVSAVCSTTRHQAASRSITLRMISIGLGEAGERRQYAFDHRIVGRLGGELARSGEEGVQSLECPPSIVRDRH
jgi:hypothetical protein